MEIQSTQPLTRIRKYHMRDPKTANIIMFLGKLNSKAQRPTQPNLVQRKERITGLQRTNMKEGKSHLREKRLIILNTRDMS